jgi:hypothetical protein
MVPSLLRPILAEYLRHKVKDLIGKDPYKIDSREFLGNIEIPCFIMSAEDDDYIPMSQGLDVLSLLQATVGAFRSFKGGHFDPRPRLVVMEAEKFVRNYLLTISTFFNENDNSMFCNISQLNTAAGVLKSTNKHFSMKKVGSFLVLPKSVYKFKFVKKSFSVDSGLSQRNEIVCPDKHESERHVSLEEEDVNGDTVGLML